MQIKISFRNELLLGFILIGLLTMGIISYLGYNNSKNAIEEVSFKKLTAVREIKGTQIEDYFQQIRNQVISFSESRMVIDAMNAFKADFHQIEDELGSTDLSSADEALRNYYQNEFLTRLNANLSQPADINTYLPETTTTRLLQNLYIASNSEPTGSKDNLNQANDGSAYSQTHARYHPIIRSYLQKFGYYDIFLIDPDTGHIVYSVFKEVDFATSLLTGPYRDTNFAMAFKEAQSASNKDFVKLEDFQSYAPSYNAAASFIASPIYDGDEKIGVLVFQMPLDTINDIMTSKQKWSDMGLGDSGETYIVGADFKLKSQSRFLLEDRENYLQQLETLGIDQATIQQIQNTGSAIGLQEIKTHGTEAALSGKTDIEMFSDYRGVSILSAYRPLQIEGVQWVILSEIDVAEAFASINSLLLQYGISLLVLMLVFITAGFLLSARVLRQIGGDPAEIVKITNEVANGNLDLEFDNTTKDIGIQGAIKRMVDSLNGAFLEVVSASDELARGANRLLASSQSMATGASTQASALEEISASMHSLATQTEDNAKNATQVHDLAATTSDTAEEGNEKMGQMVQSMSGINDSSKNISKIIKVIDEIAFQTNLLALNAAVEAARAGAHGKGFAVVAEEVRSLAGRSAQAAKETTDLIENSLHKVSEGMTIASNTATALTEAVSGIQKVDDLSGEIASASNAQAEGINQVNQGLTQMENITQQNAENADQVAQIAEQVSSQSSKLQQLTGRFKIKGHVEEKGELMLF